MSWLSLVASNMLLASLIAFAAWIVQRRRGRPAIARALWALALVKLATPPLVCWPLVELPSAMACSIGACGCGDQHANLLAAAGRTLPAIVLAAWAIGSAIAAVAAARRWRQFRRLVALGRPAPRPWQLLAKRLAGELRLRRTPHVWAVPGRLPPLVVPGFGRARVLLPWKLVRRMSEAQREALLLHELVHVRRGDHLMRLVELAVSVAYWWLPAVRSMGRRLRSCEEACCDAAVVSRRPEARRDYARLLLDVVDFTDPLPRLAPQATGMSAAHDLEARLRAILGGAGSRRRSRLAGAAVVGLALAALPCGVGYEFASPGFAADANSRAAGKLEVAADTRAVTDKEMTDKVESWTGCEPPRPSLEAMRCPELPQDLPRPR